MNRLQQSANERFTREQVRRILRITGRDLSAWERLGLIHPASVSVAAASKPGAAAVSYTYTFSDIITLKTLLKLRKNGVPPARLRLADAALKANLSEVENPWSKLQFSSSGKKISVRFQGITLEPLTGQLFFDYVPRAPRDVQRDAITAIREFRRASNSKKLSSADKIRIAERYFLKGMRYEEGGGETNKAIQAYQRAIEMNPNAIGAFINLGTIYYNLHQLEASESCYLSALSLDPSYALVHFNLGNVFDEQNELDKARKHYEEAVLRDPEYPDPHYNLGLVYEKLGLHGKARKQWLRYLKLDPCSQWAAYAREQLEKTPLRLIHNNPAVRAAVTDLTQS